MVKNEMAFNNIIGKFPTYMFETPFGNLEILLTPSQASSIFSMRISSM